MRSNTFPATLTAASAIAAAIAALTLSACDPNDTTEAAMVAPSTQMQAAQPDAPAPVVPAAVTATPPPPLQGTPVPAAAPQPAYPPRAAYPAQSRYPAPTTPYADAPPPNPVIERHAAEAAVDRGHVGSVARIEPIRERPQGSGAGAVIGGVLGAVVGNQFGHGAGRAGMTGAGAVGGAIAGNNLERNHREEITGYRVSIRLDNGATRTFERSQISGLQVGDRVQLGAGTFGRV